MEPVIVTRCGYFDFRSPDEYEFEIDVIGRALSKLCRFTGQRVKPSPTRIVARPPDVAYHMFMHRWQAVRGRVN